MEGRRVYYNHSKKALLPMQAIYKKKKKAMQSMQTVQALQAMQASNVHASNASDQCK